LRAVGSERVALFGAEAGGTIMLLFAASYPERVTALALFAPVIYYWRTPDFRSDRRGREIKTMGDGFLATFEGPARAVYCARAIAEHVRPLGIEVRSGLHTGEVELDGDDIAGLGVAIGARVGAMGGPSEVLVPRP
jgi:class 3 adenylate cyclase